MKGKRNFLSFVTYLVGILNVWKWTAVCPIGELTLQSIGKVSPVILYPLFPGYMNSLHVQNGTIGQKQHSLPLVFNLIPP